MRLKTLFCLYKEILIYPGARMAMVNTVIFVSESENIIK